MRDKSVSLHKQEIDIGGAERGNEVIFPGAACVVAPRQGNLHFTGGWRYVREDRQSSNCGAANDGAVWKAKRCRDHPRAKVFQEGCGLFRGNVAVAAGVICGYAVAFAKNVLLLLSRKNMSVGTGVRWGRLLRRR